MANTAETSTAASISCKCGHVKIGLACREPVYTAECGCVDCIGNCRMCASLGGVEVPADIVSHDRCFLLYYYPDKFVVNEGKDKLAFSKIRADGNATFCLATCCHTPVLVDHAFYHQGEGKPGSTDGSGMVMCYETLTPTGVEAKKTDIRWWIKDIPEEKLHQMAELPGFYLAESGNFDTMRFTDGGEEAFGKFGKAAAAPAVELSNGMNFAELLAACGGKVEVRNYEEEAPLATK